MFCLQHLLDYSPPEATCDFPGVHSRDSSCMTSCPTVICGSYSVLARACRPVVLAKASRPVVLAKACRPVVLAKACRPVEGWLLCRFWLPR